MKKIIKIIALLMIPYSFLAAVDDIANKSELYLERTRKATGDLTKEVYMGKRVNDKTDLGGFEDYSDTVIWNDSYTQKTNKAKQMQTLTAAKPEIILDSPLLRLDHKWQAEEKKLALQKQKLVAKAKEIPSYFVGGYCTFEKTLKISKFSKYGKLDCMLNFGNNQYKRVEVFASFYPDYKREMVMALPLYISFENQNRALFSGIILKEDKSSVNLAGWVNNQRIRKMLDEGLLLANDTIYNYTIGYMSAVKASEEDTRIDYIPSTGPDGNTIVTPVITKKTAPPEIKNYITAAAVDLFTGLFSIIGRDDLSRVEPLFAVYPQKVYIEGIVSFDKKGLATRFGKMSSKQEKEATQNNQNWIDKRNQTIERYNRGYNKGAEALGGSN